ncbi:MAG: sodium:proton antiporter [Chthoniobacteraceae bacterium]
MFLPLLPIAVTAVSSPPLWLVGPFVLLLLCIAAMPFIHPHWWEKNYPVVACGLGGFTVIYYLVGLHHAERVLHTAHEYVSFIALIGSLYIVAGGIHLRVKGEARPLGNVLFLFLGAVLANLIGTTGASMLLIRPWIRMNKYRITAFHIVFFIFIVSNAGGCLTPIGDPPLFLGYLKGVPFWWVLEHCWWPWVVMVGGLLAAFWVLDRRNFRRAPETLRAAETGNEQWRFDGLVNVLFLLLILGSVFIKSPTGLRETVMILAAFGSWFCTPQRIHEANAFNFHPLLEVGWLFIGIFGTMMPAFDYLEVHAPVLGIDSAEKFYWLTGGLSGVLDNAPTYLTFLAVAFGNGGLVLDDPADMQVFLQQHPVELLAISLGAVFFGAFTYIGNGPNFMVKAIAQHARVKVPDFFNYLLRYSLPFLLPLLALIALLFVRGE